MGFPFVSLADGLGGAKYGIVPRVVPGLPYAVQYIGGDRGHGRNATLHSGFHLEWISRQSIRSAKSTLRSSNVPDSFHVKIEIQKIQDMPCRKPRGTKGINKGGHGSEMGRDETVPDRRAPRTPHASPRWTRIAVPRPLPESIEPRTGVACRWGADAPGPEWLSEPGRREDEAGL